MLWAESRARRRAAWLGETPRVSANDWYAQMRVGLGIGDRPSGNIVPVTRAILARVGLLCSALLSCGGEGTPSTDGGRDAPPALSENTAAMCRDGQDNDGDGFADCAEDPNHVCNDACDCGPAHCCKEDSQGINRCVKHENDPWLPGPGAGTHTFERAEGTCDSCGNGACEVGEYPETCPADCSDAQGQSKLSCGDGRCEPGEGATICAADCSCNIDGICEPWEWSCGDCDPDPTAAACTDTTLFAGEHEVCGNGRCEAASTCPDGPESCRTCPQDCGTCTWQAESGDDIPLAMTRRLQGVWGSSATAVFAVGHGGTILRYDGQTWHVARADLREPGAGYPCRSLHAIGGTLTGELFVTGDRQLLLQHCPGGTCPKTPPPSPVDGGTLPLDAGPPQPSCSNSTCDLGESCDGRYATVPCPQDCPGANLGNPQKEYCFVNGVCMGPGCT